MWNRIGINAVPLAFILFGIVNFENSARAVTSDDGHGGNDGLYFQRPLVANQAPLGAFDRTLSPTVQIDEIAPQTVTGMRIFTMGRGDDHIHAERDHYEVLWETDRDVHRGATYRIHVLLAGRELGFTDVDYPGRKRSEWGRLSEGFRDDRRAGDVVELGRHLDLSFDARRGDDGCGVIGADDTYHLSSDCSLPIRFFLNGCAAVVCTASDQCHSAGVCDPTTVTCSNPAVADGTACDDGDACTQTDLCESGACQGTNPVVCTASDQCHSAGTCDSSTGLCSNPAVADGTACDDGDACTQTDLCESGVCQGTNPVVCTASDQCHVAGTCDPSSGVCSNPAAADGTGCDDGNACTQSDVCQAGVCQGTDPVVCAAADQCHLAGTCDPSSGLCSNPVAADGTACNDGNACTQKDLCEAGVCEGTTPVTCAASDQCHVAGTCDPATGACSNPNAADGTSCDDGNACTRTDACEGGVCKGTQAVTCAAIDQCHAPGTCDPSTGQCDSPVAPDGTACDDGNACTSGDACESGLCQGGGPTCQNGATCNPGSVAVCSCTPGFSGATCGDVCSAQPPCDAPVSPGTVHLIPAFAYFPGTAYDSSFSHRYADAHGTITWTATGCTLNVDGLPPGTALSAYLDLNGSNRQEVSTAGPSFSGLGSFTVDSCGVGTLDCSSAIGEATSVFVNVFDSGTILISDDLNATSSPASTAGVCATPCTGGLCDNVCTALASDPQNCGACGRVCPASATCDNSFCWTTITSDTSASANEGYIADGTTPISLLLPLSSALSVGDQIKLAVHGSGPVTLALNPGQRLQNGDTGLGMNWVQTGAPQATWSGVASSLDGSDVVAVVNGGGIYTSTDSGTTWVQTSAPDDAWTGVASSLDGRHLIAIIDGGGIYASTDAGASWSRSDAPGANWTALACSSDGTHVFAAADGGGVYASTDGGQTWTLTSAPPGAWRSLAASADGSHLVAAEWGVGLYASQDAGASWTLALPSAASWTSVASSGDGSHLAAAASNGGGVYTSSDSGGTWTQSSAPGANWAAVASSSDGGHLAALVSGGTIFTSSDAGGSWTATDAPPAPWSALAPLGDGSEWVAAASGGGIYWTTSVANTGSSITLSYAGSGVLQVSVP